MTARGASRTVPRVSEPTDTPASPAAPAEEPPEAAPAPAQSPAWDLVQRLKAEGATREVMLERLKGQGLDDEAAKVLVNSVVGRLPAELPSAQLTGGNDLLSPSLYTLSDIGLTGPPTVVGLYWMGFGVAILLALALAWILSAAGLVSVPEDVGEYAFRIGGFASAACLVWGAYRYSQGIVIRRKP